jgi:hypothetical protein
MACRTVYHHMHARMFTRLPPPPPLSLSLSLPLPPSLPPSLCSGSAAPLPSAGAPIVPLDGCTHADRCGVVFAMHLSRPAAIDGQTGRPARPGPGPVQPGPFRARPVRHVGLTVPGLTDPRASNAGRTRHCSGLNVPGWPG